MPRVLGTTADESKPWRKVRTPFLRTLNSLFWMPVSFFRTRSAMSRRSSGEKHFARMGESGSQNPTKIPQANVKQPRSCAYDYHHGTPSAAHDKTADVP